MVKMRGTEAYISISIYWIVNTDMHRIFVLDQRSHHNADEGKKIEIKEETLVDIGIDIYNNEFNGSSINEKKENILTNGDPNLKKRGYGEIGRRYGLNWIEPWYGNLLSEYFQIQGNPGINKRQS